MSEDTGWSTIDDAQSEIDLNGAVPTISCSDNNSLYVFYQSSGDIHRQHNFTQYVVNIQL